MREIGFYIFAILLIAVPATVITSVSLRRQRRYDAEIAQLDEDMRVLARRSSERNFRMTGEAVVHYNADEFIPSPEFEAWASEHLRQTLDIEYYAGHPFIFLKDEDEAFAYRMRWT